MNQSSFSKVRLGRLHDILTGHVENGGVPGLVALASRRGHQHVEVLGRQALGAPEPMRRDTIFRISSMTKPVTAVAALILIEECKLRLDDPVDRWLPELAGRRVLRSLEGALGDTVPAKRPISVRDLLTFRMGFGQLMAPPDAYPILKAAHELQIGMGPPQPSAVPPPDEWLRRLGSLPLMFQPGERWIYNTGSDVLGVLIARVSGQPFSVFLKERVFQPLGMKDTAFAVGAEDLGRFVTGYWAPSASGALEVFDPSRGGQWNQPPAFESGAAGLVSTADDFLAFASMLLNGGRHGRERILSRPAVETMSCDQLSPAQKATASLAPGYFEDHGWGLGVSVVTRRRGLADPVGKYGWDGGLGTSWASDPTEGLITILLTQKMWASPSPPAVCRDFATGVYQAIED